MAPGIWEILLICLVALVFVKPDELPRIMRKISRWYARVSRSPRSIWDDLDKQMGPERPVEQPGDRSIASADSHAQASEAQVSDAPPPDKEDVG